VFWLVWIALGVGGTAVVASVAFVVVRGLALWRQLKATAAAASAELERLAASAEQVAARAERLGEGAPRLSERLERLRRTQARLGILLAAWGDVRSSVERITAVVPRK
jgi:hypothetical protein